MFMWDNISLVENQNWTSSGVKIGEVSIKWMSINLERSCKVNVARTLYFFFFLNKNKKKNSYYRETKKRNENTFWKNDTNGQIINDCVIEIDGKRNAQDVSAWILRIIENIVREWQVESQIKSSLPASEKRETRNQLEFRDLAILKQERTCDISDFVTIINITSVSRQMLGHDWDMSGSLISGSLIVKAGESTFQFGTIVLQKVSFLNSNVSPVWDFDFFDEGSDCDERLVVLVVNTEWRDRKWGKIFVGSVGDGISFVNSRCLLWEFLNCAAGKLNMGLLCGCLFWGFMRFEILFSLSQLDYSFFFFTLYGEKKKWLSS